MSIQSGQFLYPNVTTVPGQSGVQDGRVNKQDQGAKGEFDQLLDKVAVQPQPQSQGNLGQVRAPLKFSAHATQRLNERKIQLDQATLVKVNEAVDKAAAKGLEDTLILTPNSALIVNVGNRTVITAMDRGQLQGNVFTNIDGAVVI
ncbi:MAG: TIGR02530 family flagellar biosynthesis protein [Oligoflexia bacterium]|jgi:flagellar operon protein